MKLEIPNVQSDQMLHLDALRFAAAAGIVVCHSAEFLWPAENRAIPRAMFANLPLLVEVFFVISGYIITQVYQSRIGTAGEYLKFMQRRAGRIYPLHIIIFIVQLAIALAIQVSGRPMAHPPSLTADCLVSNLVLAHAVLPCGGYPLSGVTWSLSAEMVMYAMLPLLLLCCKGSWARAVIFAVISFVVIFSIYPANTEWQSHVDLGRAPAAFLFGMALCFARDRLKIIPFPSITLAAFFFFFLIAWPLGVRSSWMIVLAHIIPVFAIAADVQQKRSPIVSCLAPLGQLTYSIYMIHGVFVLVVLNAFGDKILRLSTGPMLLLLIVTYAMVFVTSLASYQYVENPARKWVDRFRLTNWPSINPLKRSRSTDETEGSK